MMNTCRIGGRVEAVVVTAPRAAGRDARVLAAALPEAAAAAIRTPDTAIRIAAVRRRCCRTIAPLVGLQAIIRPAVVVLRRFAGSRIALTGSKGMQATPERHSTLL
jgi:hypothetical protein